MKNIITFTFFVVLLQYSLVAQQSDYYKKIAEYKAKQKTLEENIKLTTPNNSTDFNQPFLIKGYGVPGAQIEITIIPNCVLVKDSKPVFISKGKVNPYKNQIYYINVDENGNWTLPNKVSVKFINGSTQRFVRILLSQNKNNIKANKPYDKVIKLDNNNKPIILKSIK